MLRDNLVSGAGPHPLAPRTNRIQSSDDRPACLENPRPAGAESTLTENVASPFHAEPGQCREQQAIQTLTTAEWKAICRYYDHRCLNCGRQEPEIKLTIDHV